MAPRGGARGGARGGRGGGAYNAARGTVSIAGVELAWDLSGVKIERTPAERFPVSTPLCPFRINILFFLAPPDAHCPVFFGLVHYTRPFLTKPIYHVY